MPSAASATATTDRPRRPVARVRPYALLFLGLSVVYHSNLRPIASGDSVASALIPLSVVLDGSVRLDRFGPWLQNNVPHSEAFLRQAGSHWYSSYPIAGPLLASPLYVPLLAVPNIRQWQPGSLVALARILEKVTASAYAAMSAVLLLMLLERLSPRRCAWALILVYALGTATWSTSSQALWQHGPGQLAIVACLLFLERWWAARQPEWMWWSGACAGLAVMMRPLNIVLLPALALALIFSRASVREYVRAFAPAAAAGLLLLAYNLAVFQSPSGAYLSTFQSDWIAGLSGILFSPGRGLLVYSPAALFAIFALSRRSRPARAAHLPLFVISAAFIINCCIVVSIWRIWWGGYCWGPRMLTEIMPPLIVLIALGTPALDAKWTKRTFATLAVYGCLIQAVGVYYYPNGHWDHTPVPIDRAPARVWNWRDNPIGRTIAAGPVWQPYAIVWAALKDGVPGAGRRLRELNIHSY